MAHYRKAVGAAAALNLGVSVAEAIAGAGANSASLLMDSIHNFSDELSLIFLFLAFLLQRLSRNLVRSANLFNSVGLLMVSVFLVWHALERLAEPMTVSGFLPVAIGLFAAVGNWGVARLLLAPGRNNAAIRLAYIHNLGDVLVSLAPVLAGLLVTIFHRSFFDSLIAIFIALFFIWSTIREVIASRDELIWPEHVTCGHET